MQATAGSTDGDNKWKFAQCFGDKGESDDITEGKLFERVSIFLCEVIKALLFP